MSNIKSKEALDEYKLKSIKTLEQRIRSMDAKSLQVLRFELLRLKHKYEELQNKYNTRSRGF